MAWDKQFYDANYRIQFGGQTIHYGREFAKRVMDRHTEELTFYIDRWTKLKRLSWWRNLERRDILFIGCGFGFLMEVATDDGYSSMFGLDTSTWINTAKNTETRNDIRPKIHNIDVTSLTVEADLLLATGKARFDVVITEDVVTDFLDDKGLVSFLNAVEALLKPGTQSNRIVHMVTVKAANPITFQEPTLRWLTLSDWVTKRPSHTWYDVPNGLFVEGV